MQEQTQPPNQQQQKPVTIRFLHPKLVDKNINIAMFECLMDLRSDFSEHSLLFFFDNYHFQQKGKRLSEVDLIGDVVTLDLAVDVVLHAFDQRTAKFHFSKLADIVNNPDLYVYTLRNQNQAELGQYEKINPVEREEKIGNKTFSFENIDYSLGNQFLMESNKQPSVELLHFICFSGFNPPPNNQRLNGDLFYIHVRTLECSDVHITATPQGYFVNQSKISSFNPQISTTNKTVYVSLLDLLRAVSDKFQMTLEAYAEEKVLSEAEIYQINFRNRGAPQLHWLEACDYQHTWNSRKSLKADYFKMESVGIKDWNQMFQMNSQLPIPQPGSIQEIQKVKNFMMMYTEFQAAAIQGSRNLIDGKIPPLNPMDDTKKHIYIYNNIFFSIANQTPFDHSQEKGEEATPSSSAINVDIVNLEILEGLQVPDLHLLHMVVVCYRGFKVIAQCIIPGILTGDQSNCSQYGSIDDGKTIETNPEFQKLMVEVCDKMNLKGKIQVRDGKGEEKTIAGSPDIKGILGSDKRKYILDLLRLSPRDLNYIGIQNQVCVIRPELVNAFKAKKKDLKEEMSPINTNIGTEIEFIPDSDSQQQTVLLKEMAQYIIQTAIPQLIVSLKSGLGNSLTDSKGISSTFHKHGVNLRYLGQVCNHASLKDSIDIRICLERVILAKSLKHLFKMAMRDTNILYLNSTIANLLNCILGKRSQICVMEEGNGVQNLGNLVDVKDAKKKKKKKNKEIDQEANGNRHVFSSIPPIKVQASEYMTMKPSELWEVVKKLADKRFAFALSENIVDYELFKIPYQKLATLRDLCLSTGIALEKKEYNILDQLKPENDKTLAFSVKNIAGLNPIPKKRNLKPQFINQLMKTADSHFDKYSMPQALLAYNQANTSLSIIGGSLIQDLAYIRSKIGKIFYVMGSYQQAIDSQLTALNILKAVSTHDSAKAIQSYSTLGLYYSVKGEKSKALFYLYKSIFLMLVSFGETYQDFLINVVNLARVYHQNAEYSRVSEVYMQAISILKKINGKYHFKVSFLESSLATLHYELLDVKKAIECQTESVSILLKLLPENDNRLVDATKILKRYQEVNANNSQNYMGQMPPRPTYDMNPKEKSEGQIKSVNKSRKGKK